MLALVHQRSLVFGHMLLPFIMFTGLVASGQSHCHVIRGWQSLSLATRETVPSFLPLLQHIFILISTFLPQCLLFSLIVSLKAPSATCNLFRSPIYTGYFCGLAEIEGGSMIRILLHSLHRILHAFNAQINVKIKQPHQHKTSIVHI